jgi:hypothetical protein
LLVDWSAQAGELVGQLRGHLAEYPHAVRGTELVEDLKAASPKFVEMWQKHSVRGFETSRKRFDHPERGRLNLDYIKLAAASNDQQHLVVFLPADAASGAKLTHLPEPR